MFGMLNAMWISIVMRAKVMLRVTPAKVLFIKLLAPKNQTTISNHKDILTSIEINVHTNEGIPSVAVILLYCSSVFCECELILTL